MDMKIDPQFIRRLREERAWSQEHLASVSGLSVRTIQRLETSGNASHESRLALASAFEIDASAFVGMEFPEEASLSSTELPREPTAAPGGAEPVEEWTRFRNHLIQYLVACVGFVVLDLLLSGRITWAHWPILGWGIGVMSHGFKAWNRVHSAPLR